MNPLTQSKKTTILPLLIALTLACFALSPQARAVCQEGCLANDNTVLGFDALFSNTIGNDNTAIGFDALYSNTTGFQNTATGLGALYSNTSGAGNTADGFNALYSNITGSVNTATGYQALFSNTTGSVNTAIGFDALRSNTTATGNTAIGAGALFSNRTGNNNTANGSNALFSNRNGVGNTANGFEALSGNRTGNNNTANGHNALSGNTTGSFNIALGFEAGLNLSTGDNNIHVGNRGIAGEANTIRIGTTEKQTNTFIAGIRGVTTQNANAIPVLIDSAGQLGTMSSSQRFKKEIKPMDQTSEAILSLKPVMFHYKSDNKGTPQFGLIAEEVAQVNPDLVVRDGNGEIYTVRYEAINAMLLNEFLKEHREVQEQKATIAEFKKEIVNLTATVKEQAAQIQKVSAQIEVTKPAPQVVTNNQ